MRALTVQPGQPGSARVEDVAEPPEAAGAVLVKALALGICGTDREIAAGEYGWSPEGERGSCSGTSRWDACSRPPTAAM